MITNFPQDFLDELIKTSRKPVQLMEFILPDETFYLSDKVVGILDGLLHDYQPWVESWGTLSDNTALSNVLEGDSLEIRSATITLIVSPVSRTFVKKLFQSGVENTKVNLYQWFPGVASGPQLIDVFVCQDPISFSEASMLLNIDLVSPLMATNPYLWPEVAGMETQPVVIGKATGMPLKNLQTTQVTKLAQDITFGATGNIFIDNGVGFQASGVVSIDSEDLAYDYITASVINITARAQNGTTARPHYRGGLVVPYGGIFDYAICSGPVATVDHLLGNGEAYLNPVTFFPSSNPVIARFTGRPPWLRVEPGAGGDPIVPDPVTSTEYGGATEANYSAPASSPSGNINSPSGLATMAITQSTGGGPGSFTKYGTTSYTNNLGINNYQKIGGSLQTYGDGSLWSKSGVFGNIIDGAIGSVDVKYGHNDTAYGNITAASVTVVFGVGSDIIQSHSKLRVILVSAGGATTTLQEWDIDGLSRVFGDGYVPPWYNASFTYNISVSTFALLADTRIRIELENIHSKTAAEYSTTADRTTVDLNYITWNISYFIPSGVIPDPSQEYVSKFNYDKSSLGSLSNVTAIVRVAFTLTNSTCNLKIVKRSTTNPADDVSLWSASGATGSIGVTNYTFNLGSMSWAALAALRIGVYHQITGPDTEGVTRAISTAFYYVQWVITYQPGDIPTPDELRVVYADDMVCDVTSLMGADPTPPEVVKYLIDNNSESGQYIDTVDFNLAHAQYENVSYYLNGVLDANTRLHEGLKTVLGEGMCRLLFNQGKIKLLSYFDQEDPEVDYEVSLDDVQLRSRRTDNQPTEQIRNDVTIMHSRNYLDDVYNEKINLSDAESIAKFQLKDYRRELRLINSAYVANLYAERILRIYSKPTSIYSFNMFLAAYLLEKGDRISIRTFLDPRFTSTGHILSLRRTFGQGKNQKINTINIQLYNPQSTADLDLEDSVIVNDAVIRILKGLILPSEVVLVDDSKISTSRQVELAERLYISDTLLPSLCAPNGFGSCGYGYHTYGA
jgi:hypothetical protein